MKKEDIIRHIEKRFPIKFNFFGSYVYFNYAEPKYINKVKSEDVERFVMTYFRKRWDIMVCVV